ncbi:MAG: inositol monophosphatase [Leptospiraceae bacterium]|nr:inositol monophosphatase [Leptospiraceae bacterium]
MKSAPYPKQPDLKGVQDRLTAIQAILNDLGRDLIRIQQRELQIKTKSNALDLVTQADFLSEERIKTWVQTHYPDDAILAEESGRSIPNQDSGLTWVIDPIDGTINFAHGLPLFSISIGLAQGSQALGGLVYVPAMKDLYSASQGQGAWKNGQRIQVSKRSEFSQALVVTGFPYSRHKYIDQLTNVVRCLLLKGRGLRRTGAASIDLCWLAEGRFDAYYELILQPWDTCAGSAILSEAGGQLTDLFGEHWDISHQTLCASNGLVQAEFLECLTGLQELPELQIRHF